MCIFSGTVKHVARTRIFARLSGSGTQFLVYQMAYQASHALAMILPIPVRLPAQETSVAFIDLQKYPLFFQDMDTGFPAPRVWTGCYSLSDDTASAPPLAVHSVGDYSASFVPTVNDFDRLDRQFVLPPTVWADLPDYQDFGFVVFKLKAASRVTGVHPMAFAFDTRFDDRLFLPTLHIHDGQVHPTEHYDHALYVQDARLAERKSGMQRSPKSADQFVYVPATQNIVQADLPCFKRSVVGEYTNRDITIRVA